MNLETLAAIVKRVEDDVTEVKKDVKSLMLFMAVEKDRAKKNTMITSALMSLLVSLVVLVAGKLL